MSSLATGANSTHQARPLLAARWHVDFIDLFMATSPELLDPRRAVPSSALA